MGGRRWRAGVRRRERLERGWWWWLRDAGAPPTRTHPLTPPLLSPSIPPLFNPSLHPSCHHAGHARPRPLRGRLLGCQGEGVGRWPRRARGGRAEESRLECQYIEASMGERAWAEGAAPSWAGAGTTAWPTYCVAQAGRSASRRGRGSPSEVDGVPACPFFVPAAPAAAPRRSTPSIAKGPALAVLPLRASARHAVGRACPPSNPAHCGVAGAGHALDGRVGRGQSLLWSRASGRGPLSPPPPPSLTLYGRAWVRPAAGAGDDAPLPTLPLHIPTTSPTHTHSPPRPRPRPPSWPSRPRPWSRPPPSRSRSRLARRLPSTRPP
jgi:hypothetical protein